MLSDKDNDEKAPDQPQDGPPALAPVSAPGPASPPSDHSLIASEIRFRRLFESAQDGILILDGRTGKITESNPFIATLLEYAEQELMGKELWEIGLFEDRQKSQDTFAHLRASGYVRYEDLPLKTRTGKTREVEFVSNAYDSGGERVIQCNIRDITERKTAERALHAAHAAIQKTVLALGERNREFALLSEIADALQTCVSVEEAYRVVARCAVPLFPETHGVLYAMDNTGKALEIAIEWGGAIGSGNEFLPSECVSLRRGRVHEVVEENANTNLMCRHVAPAVSNYLCAPMIAYGETQGVLHLRRAAVQGGHVEASPRVFEGFKLGLAGTVADYIGLALANLKLRERLRHQAIHDHVTGLYNRHYMKEALERELRRAIRHRHPLGIIMLDVDHFKKLNDAFGHDAGDMVLHALGAFLRKQVRGNDIACRYGGEEFLIILPGMPLRECLARAERLREEVGRLNLQYGGEVLPQTTFSVGVSCCPDHGDDLEELLKVGDTALYRAKTAGRDRVVAGQIPLRPRIEAEAGQFPSRN